MASPITLIIEKHNIIPPPCPIHGMLEGLVVWQCRQKTVENLAFSWKDMLQVIFLELCRQFFRIFSELFSPSRLIFANILVENLVSF